MGFLKGFWIWGCVLAAGIGFYGFQELRLGGVAKQEAQRISCADLAEKGPGDNAHIVLTDCVLLSHDYVYEERRGKWTTVFIPAIPIAELTTWQQAEDGSLHVPKNIRFRVIVKSSEVTSEAEADRFGQQETVKGVVINEISSLDSETKKLLAESYPGTDLDSCWILEHDRNLPSAGVAMGAIAGGGLLLLFSLWLGLMYRPKT